MSRHAVSELALQVSLFRWDELTGYGARGQGFDADNKSTASPGWDESCMLHAQQFAIDRLVWSVGKTQVIEVLKKETGE